MHQSQQIKNLHGEEDREEALKRKALTHIHTMRGREAMEDDATTNFTFVRLQASHET